MKRSIYFTNIPHISNRGLISRFLVFLSHGEKWPERNGGQRGVLTESYGAPHPPFGHLLPMGEGNGEGKNRRWIARTSFIVVG